MKKAVTILAAVILAYLLLRFDYTSFWDSIKQVSAAAMAGLLMLQIVSQLLLNYQWCSLGRVMGRGSDFMKMLYVNSRGMIIECITPGAKIGGEVTRAILLKKEMEYTAEEAATLVAIQKMVSLSAFFILNLAALVHISGKVAFLQDVRWIVYLFLILLISAFGGIFFFGHRLEEKIEKYEPKRKWTIKLRDFFLTLLTHTKSIKKAELAKQFLLSVFIWVLFPVKMVILVSLFTANFDILYLVEITFISYMVGMIPLLPGGLGSFEATMTGLLLVMNIPSGEAAAVTVLFRFVTFWFVILISAAFSGAWKLGIIGKTNIPRRKIS